MTRLQGSLARHGLQQRSRTLSRFALSSWHKSGYADCCLISNTLSQGPRMDAGLLPPIHKSGGCVQHGAAC